MKIRVIWVGKTKEQFIHDGLQKYIKLLRPYADMDIVEIREEKGKDIQRMVEREGERILKRRTGYVLLDEKGKNLTSPEFSEFIGKNAPEINFVLGGAYGVSERVKGAAKHKLALSGMTLTHEMSRLLLFEQIYRAFAIIHKRGYHH